MTDIDHAKAARDFLQWVDDVYALPARTREILHDHCVRCWKHVEELTIAEIMSWRGVGPVTAAQIEQWALERRGITLPAVLVELK